MKNLKLSKELSRDEMRSIKGGKLPGGGIGGGGSTTCYDSSKICYSEGGINYTCSAPPEVTSEEDCCCGHSSGDNIDCVMG